MFAKDSIGDSLNNTELQGEKGQKESEGMGEKENGSGIKRHPSYRGEPPEGTQLALGQGHNSTDG
jgi:hypothetical protein